MAALPPLKRVTTEDFPEQKGWIAKLLQPLNSFFDSVYNALNKNLTFADNFKAMVKTVTVDNTQATFSPIHVASTIGRPAGLWVVGLVDKAGQPATVRGAVSVDWTYVNGTISINRVGGLRTYSSATTTSGSTTLSNITNIESVIVGQTVTGANIPAGTTVIAISATNVQMSAAATLSVTGMTAFFSGKSYNLTFIAVAG